MKNFTEEEVTPARATADALAKAMIDLVAAEKALKKAKKSVPMYTAQWRDEDYYKDELDVRNRAAEALEEAVLASVWKANGDPSK